MFFLKIGSGTLQQIRRRSWPATRIKKKERKKKEKKREREIEREKIKNRDRKEREKEEKQRQGFEREMRASIFMRWAIWGSSDKSHKEGWMSYVSKWGWVGARCSAAWEDPTPFLQANLSARNAVLLFRCCSTNRGLCKWMSPAHLVLSLRLRHRPHSTYLPTCSQGRWWRRTPSLKTWRRCTGDRQFSFKRRIFSTTIVILLVFSVFNN